MKFKKFFVMAALLVSGTAMMTAQQMQMPQMPVDKDVRIGKLDNGLTYYIRRNGYPEHVANFYIAQKVGSINENDDQRGLAHFLEHMAFNGSDHFKGNAMQEYLQSIGVEYGRNLNAYTSTDQTVYYINDVPSARISALDSCLLVLKDWSNGLTLTSEAIDEERDIIHNEYRMRITGSQKILETVLPDLYPGSKYGQRFPIGLMEIIDGCNPETLRAYYRKWYYPKNQGIIVVGDIDVDRTEAKIKEMFGGIKTPAGAADVVPEKVPDNENAIYVIGKDKEMQATVFNIMMKHEPVPQEVKNSVAYFVIDYAKAVIAAMANARLSEMAQQPDCPFLQSQVNDGHYLVSRTMDAFNAIVVPKEGKELEALAAMMRELKRIDEFGFTATEYERAKADVLAQIENLYNNREKQPNDFYCQQYVQHFIDGEPIPSLEEQYQMLNQMVPMLNVDVANQIVKEFITEVDTNLVILSMMQEKEGKQYFTKDDMKKVVEGVRSEKLEAYVDNVKQEPLMATLPKAGKIVKETENKQLGFKELTLSNGVKVMMKKTDFNADEILFKAVAEGGFSMFDKKDNNNLIGMQFLLSQTGLGNFSNTDLQKVLAGKKCGVQMSVNNFTHGFSGNSTPKDLETMMQLLYLNFTALNKDEKAMDNMRQNISLVLKNMSLNADLVFEDSIGSITYQNNPLFRVPTAEAVADINLDRMMEMAHQLNGNAADFTFMFSGNYDEALLRQYIEQYIASLPSTGKATSKGKEIRTFANGVKKCSFTKEMQNPQSQAQEIWRSNPMKYTLEKMVLLNVSYRLLDMTFNREIRERLSAAYHAGADIDLDVDGPNIYYILKGVGKLNPDKALGAIPEFQKGMDATVASPNLEDLQKAKQIMLKQADEDAKTNSHWLNVMTRWILQGVDIETNYKKTVEAVTPAAISNFLKNDILKSGNHIEVVMMPEKK